MKLSNRKRLKGILMVVIGATLWGLSGTAAQYLFQYQGIAVDWLTFTRLLVSGITLLVFSYYINKQSIWKIWKDKQIAFQLVIFAFFGMLGVQYTYFASISYGNAAAATLLQYLAPVFITMYIILKKRKMPSLATIVAILLALIGTFLLLTNGHFHKLSVSMPAIIWGVLSGLALAFYTLSSAALIKKWGSILIVGWGMSLGGVFLAILSPPVIPNWEEWSFITVLLLIFVVLFGTLLAFYLYIESLRFISPTDASLLSSAEPLSAAVATIMILNISFGYFQLVGGGLILATVLILSKKKS